MTVSRTGPLLLLLLPARAMERAMSPGSLNSGLGATGGPLPSSADGVQMEQRIKTAGARCEARRFRWINVAAGFL